MTLIISYGLMTHKLYFKELKPILWISDPYA